MRLQAQSGKEAGHKSAPFIESSELRQSKPTLLEITIVVALGGVGSDWKRLGGWRTSRKLWVVGSWSECLFRNCIQLVKIDQAVHLQ